MYNYYLNDMIIESVSCVPKDKDYVVINRCGSDKPFFRDLPETIRNKCIEIPIKETLASKLATKATPYVDNPNCVIILCDNSIGVEGFKISQTKLAAEFKRKETGASNEIRLDIPYILAWSIKYYLRRPEDIYMTFGSSKFWRSQHLVDLRFKKGFAVNRNMVIGSGNSAVTCMMFENKPDNTSNTCLLDVLEYKGGKLNKSVEGILLKKTHTSIECGYDNRKFKYDCLYNTFCNPDGTEYIPVKETSHNAIYNPNILGFISPEPSVLHDGCVNKFSLTSRPILTKRGFYLREDNFLEKLPIFVASACMNSTWKMTDTKSLSWDGNGAYVEDKNFLKKCLLFSLLSKDNHCMPFKDRFGNVVNSALYALGWKTLTTAMGFSDFNDYEKRILTEWEGVKIIIANNPKTKTLVPTNKIFSGYHAAIIAKQCNYTSILTTLEQYLEEYKKAELIPLLEKHLLIA